MDLILMELGKNTDFVAYTPQEESSWTFYIAGNARKASETYEEILEITKKLFKIFKGFYIPTKIEYSLLTFSEDLSSSEIFNDKPSGGTKKIIQSMDGVHFKNFCEDVQTISIPESKVKHIHGIKIDSGKTKFILNGIDDYVNKNSEYYRGWNYDRIRERPPIRDPLWIVITHSSLKNQNQRVNPDDPAFYEIVFWTRTDIWFEETDIGLKNRNRLGEVLKKIYENFEVADTLFMSDWFSEDQLKNVIFG